MKSGQVFLDVHIITSATFLGWHNLYYNLYKNWMVEMSVNWGCRVENKLFEWWKWIDAQHQDVMVQDMWQETMHHTEACRDVPERQNWNVW